MIRKETTPAEVLDRLLQQSLEGKAPPADSMPDRSGTQSDFEPLLATAVRLHELLPTRGPSPEFIAASEARLIRRVKTHISGSPRRQSRNAGHAFWLQWRPVALIAAAFIVVVFASGLGVNSASAQALPGDALYPVKQVFEEISLAFSTSAAGDASLLADFADERLEEIEQLAAKRRETDLIAGFGYYEKALDRLDAAVDQLPSGSAQLDEIQARLARHTEVLLTLRERLPDQAKSALDRAVEHSRESIERVGKLQKNQGPDELPPGQEEKPTKDTGPGSGASPSAKNNPDPKSNTSTLETTQSPEASRTPKVTKTAKPSKTPEPTKTPKPPKNPEPTKTTKPPKDKN
jgi:hypothetical protein